MLTRRAVLATGVGIGATAAVAGAVGLHLGRDLPLELAAFAPLVGDRFRVTGEGTSHEVTLTGITGARGATATAAEFSLLFSAAGPLDARSGIHRIEHASGGVDAFLAPVGAGGTELEVVVNRSAG